MNKLKLFNLKLWCITILLIVDISMNVNSDFTERSCFVLLEVVTKLHCYFDEEALLVAIELLDLVLTIELLENQLLVLGIFRGQETLVHESFLKFVFNELLDDFIKEWLVFSEQKEIEFMAGKFGVFLNFLCF